MRALLRLRRVGATLRCGARASHYGGFSCCGVWGPGVWASIVVAYGLSSCGSQALEHRLSTCGSWAYLLRGMWNPPRPGIEPMSPALAGRLLTTEPPGKPSLYILNMHRRKSKKLLNKLSKIIFPTGETWFLFYAFYFLLFKKFQLWDQKSSGWKWKYFWNSIPHWHNVCMCEHIHTRTHSYTHTHTYITVDLFRKKKCPHMKIIFRDYWN